MKNLKITMLLAICVTLFSCKKEEIKPNVETITVYQTDSIDVSDLLLSATVDQFQYNELTIDASFNVLGPFTTERVSQGQYNIKFNSPIDIANLDVFVKNNNGTATSILCGWDGTMKIQVACLNNGYLTDNIIQNAELIVIRR